MTTPRCDKHIGEPFQTRCMDCDLLANAAPRHTKPVRYIPGSRCEMHYGYPLPCDLCWRLAMETSE